MPEKNATVGALRFAEATIARRVDSAVGEKRRSKRLFSQCNGS
jgi:hypothetical protein